MDGLIANFCAESLCDRLLATARSTRRLPKSNDTGHRGPEVNTPSKSASKTIATDSPAVPVVRLIRKTTNTEHVSSPSALGAELVTVTPDHVDHEQIEKNTTSHRNPVPELEIASPMVIITEKEGNVPGSSTMGRHCNEAVTQSTNHTAEAASPGVETGNSNPPSNKTPCDRTDQSKMMMQKPLPTARDTMPSPSGANRTRGQTKSLQSQAANDIEVYSTSMLDSGTCKTNFHVFEREGTNLLEPVNTGPPVASEQNFVHTPLPPNSPTELPNLDEASLFIQSTPSGMSLDSLEHGKRSKTSDLVREDLCLASVVNSAEPPTSSDSPPLSELNESRVRMNYTNWVRKIHSKDKTAAQYAPNAHDETIVTAPSASSAMTLRNRLQHPTVLGTKPRFENEYIATLGVDSQQYVVSDWSASSAVSRYQAGGTPCLVPGTSARRASSCAESIQPASCSLPQQPSGGLATYKPDTFHAADLSGSDPSDPIADSQNTAPSFHLRQITHSNNPKQVESSRVSQAATQSENHVAEPQRAVPSSLSRPTKENETVQESQVLQVICVPPSLYIALISQCLDGGRIEAASVKAQHDQCEATQTQRDDGSAVTASVSGRYNQVRAYTPDPHTIAALMIEERNKNDSGLNAVEKPMAAGIAGMDINFIPQRVQEHAMARQKCSARVEPSGPATVKKGKKLKKKTGRANKQRLCVEKVLRSTSDETVSNKVLDKQVASASGTEKAAVVPQAPQHPKNVVKDRSDRGIMNKAGQNSWKKKQTAKSSPCKRPFSSTSQARGVPDAPDVQGDKPVRILQGAGGASGHQP